MKSFINPGYFVEVPLPFTPLLQVPGGAAAVSWWQGGQGGMAQGGREGRRRGDENELHCRWELRRGSDVNGTWDEIQDN
ncbi:hypothetical protein O3P69_001424 [Scylla paramamosain]|uniref:Uncharacterized protein n=1 Tax=Scylla paramamosain TaxID=85552 RepID=A0AAW0UXF3_SCYPA